MTDADTAIWTALIVAVPTVLTAVVVPIVMRIIENRQKNVEREAAFDREDEKENRADRKREEISDKLLANTDKLDEIHTLVNSNMTLSIQAEHDATVRELQALLKLRGTPTTAEEDVALTASIVRAQARIEQLFLILAERHAKEKA